MRLFFNALIPLLLLSVYSPRTAGQQPEITFHSSSNLVLVDVIALKNGLPVKTLTQSDFQVWDNDHRVSIKTFDTGAQFTTRPLAIWFVVICNMQGSFGVSQGSGLFAGQITRFEPALASLEKDDTVAVAHWCDDGESRLDLLPKKNNDEAVSALEQVLIAHADTKDHDRTGELALQKTLQQIVDNTRAAKPEPLPVVIFLYGDHSGMPKAEANHFIDELLETSAIAFGIKDRRSRGILFVPGEQKEVAHYIVAQTGGQYLAATPDTYAAALHEILQQLHFRYQLGFQPPALDGKRHKLTVKLVHSSNAALRGVRLRSRAAYVPVPPASR
jgi:hypothetical protein